MFVNRHLFRAQLEPGTSRKVSKSWILWNHFRFKIYRWADVTRPFGKRILNIRKVRRNLLASSFPYFKFMRPVRTATTSLLNWSLFIFLRTFIRGSLVSIYYARGISVSIFLLDGSVSWRKIIIFRFEKRIVNMSAGALFTNLFYLRPPF